MRTVQGVKLAAVGLLISFSTTEQAAGQASVEGQWSDVQDWPIEAIHSTLLPTGKVLVWQWWRSSALLWDIQTGAFADADVPMVNLFCAGHAWLPDGRLLVVGGHRPEGNSFGENFADIYDPQTEMWASDDPNVPDVPPMNLGRWYPSVTTLGNGDVLVMSGDFAPGNQNTLPQVYEHETNTWRDLTGASRVLPLYPRTVVAPDGRATVLVDRDDNTAHIDTSGSGGWTFFETTLDANLDNHASAVMYDAGKVALFGGGNNPTDNVSMIDLNDANPQWRYGADDMAQPRRQHDATILADGTVLLTGGTSASGFNDPSGAIATAEIWDPITEQVTQVAAASDVYRGYHSTATLLPDGRVLITGGNHNHNGEGPLVESRNAEIYEPAYLHNGPRPTITDAPDTVSYGETFFVQTPDAADIERALIVVPGSTTHAQNWTQRANRLEVTEVSGGVEITLTTNSNEAPPGDYLLFLIDDQGVPSVAEYVRAEFGLPGDFNGDGVVDSADYVVFRERLDVGYKPSDYQLWADNFGAATSPPSGQLPEPSSAALLAVAVFSFADFVSSRRRRTPPQPA